MKDFNQIQKLWQVQQDHNTVSYDAIVKAVEQAEGKYTNKLFYQVIAIAICIVGLCIVWFLIPLYTWTTHLAMLIAVLSISYYFLVQVRDYNNLKKNQKKLLATPEEYIQYLKKYKEHRYRLNTINYIIYATFLFLAFVLLLVEISFYISILAIILYAAITIVWFLLCHFFFMKTYITKENERLEFIIQKLEYIKKQFLTD